MILGNLFSNHFSRQGDWGTGRHPRRTRLAVEALEDRQLLSWVLPETSNAAPAIITYQDQITNSYAPYIAWTGTDSHLNIENLYTGAKNTLPDTSSAAPALAVYQGRLFLAWTGTDAQHHLNIESSIDGLNFDNKTVLLDRTSHYSDGPALAVHDQALTIGWVGSGPQTYYAYSFDPLGQSWGPSVPFPYLSFFRPSLNQFYENFVIAYTDLVGYYKAYSLTYQQLESHPDAGALLDAPSEATDDGFPGAYHLGRAWTDTNNNVWVDSDELGGAIWEGYSQYGPSLVVDHIFDYHNFYIAWTNLDGHIEYNVLDASASPQYLSSQYAPRATSNGQHDLAWAGTDQQGKVLDQANGLRPFGDPINVTSQTAPSRNANSDFYFAWTGLNTQIQNNALSKTAARDAHEFSHDGPSRAIHVAGTRRIAWTGTENHFSPFGEDLNHEVV
jgi:hypothetical protein